MHASKRSRQNTKMWAMNARIALAERIVNGRLPNGEQMQKLEHRTFHRLYQSDKKSGKPYRKTNWLKWNLLTVYTGRILCAVESKNRERVSWGKPWSVTAGSRTRHCNLYCDRYPFFFGFVLFRFDSLCIWKYRGIIKYSNGFLKFPYTNILILNTYVIYAFI